MSEYVALQPINHAGVRAYNPGDPVPADNVQTHGYEVGVQVAEVGTPEAEKVTALERPVVDAGPVDDSRAWAQEAADAGTPPEIPGDKPRTARRTDRS